MMHKFQTIWDAIVYEERTDTISGLKKLYGRSLSLNDVIDQCDKAGYGVDPIPAHEVWIEPEDYELEEVTVPGHPFDSQRLKVSFNRKLEYEPQDPTKKSTSFVHHSRTIADGKVRSRKIRKCWGLIERLIGMAKP